jgi:hypothetical protein
MKTCPSCGKTVATLITEVRTRQRYCWFCAHEDPERRGLYRVRVSFLNRHGHALNWPFEIEAVSDRHAIQEAVAIFLSGLTHAERQDAVKSLRVEARPIEELAE